ncbi:MAG: phosphopantetheine-binding protein [Patescibacteria group bacterium]
MDVRDFVLTAIAETLDLPLAVVRDDSKLVDLAEDSIKLFELLIRLENLFSYRVSYEAIVHIETVGDVIAYIETLPIDRGVLQATTQKKAA